jgi:hypothetical protein
MPMIPGKNNILPSQPVVGTDENSAGVTGQSNTGPGVWGQSLGVEGSGPGGTVLATLLGLMVFSARA